MIADATSTRDRTRSPFDPDNERDYLRWRAAKLERAPRAVAELVVEVGNPCALTAAERAAIAARCAAANMAIYASAVRAADKELPRRLGAQFGLVHLDANWLADEDGVSQVTVRDGESGRADYIPYTNRPIRWHTDGYYNPPERTIRAMVLHCVSRAAEGGANALLDHELAYLLMRDLDPAHVRALMRPDAMTIPARADESGVARPAQAGPVFSIGRDGGLHMRYTARTRSIEWSGEPAVRAAVAALERLLAADSPHVHRLTLEPGMGILCNNVLHDRAGFVDDPRQPRLLYRARFHDRVAGT